MKIGPKYKLGRRLGSHVFEKTQTQKFALRSSQKKSVKGLPKSRTAYAEQVLEKQRIRYYYGITSKQLEKYTKSVIDSRVKNQEEALFKILESRLDNIVLRSGMAQTRQMARQMATHGHFNVNDRRVDVPSYSVKEKDVVSVRNGSKTKPLFTNTAERMKDITPAKWLDVDQKALVIKIKSQPEFSKIDVPFDFGKLIQFYKR